MIVVYMKYAHRPFDVIKDTFFLDYPFGCTKSLRRWWGMRYLRERAVGMV